MAIICIKIDSVEHAIARLNLHKDDLAEIKAKAEKLTGTWKISTGSCAGANTSGVSSFIASIEAASELVSNTINLVENARDKFTFLDEQLAK